MQKVLQVLTALLCLLPSASFGQSITGAITGTVRDSSNLITPGVSLQLKNEQTGLLYRTKTNDSGIYEFLSLPPGEYEVTAELTGFQKAVVRPITLTASRTVRADIVLQTGSTSESINVSANVAAVSSDDSTVGTSVDTKLIAEVPLNGRTVGALLRIAGGVTSDTPSNPRISGSAYWGGTRFNVDGIGYNDAANGGAAYTGSHGLATLPSVDSISEMKVDSANQKAEYDGSANVTVVTKSGTNTLHGTLFEFNRNKAYAARNGSATSLPKPPFNRNEFGGTVGGPIIKSRTFFFGYYESLRERSPRTNTLSVATAAQREGNFAGLASIRDPLSNSPFPNNVVPAARFDSRSKALMAYVPLPNLPGTGAAGTLNNLVTNVPQVFNINRMGGRIDHRLSDRDNLSFVFTRSNGNPYFFANAYPATYGHRQNGGFTADNSTFTYTRTLTPSTTNDLRGAYFYHVRDTYGTNQDFNPSSLFPDLFSPLPAGGLPSMTINGHVGIGDYGGGTTRYYTTQIVDNFSHIRGRHTWKTGIDFAVERVSRPPFVLGLGSGVAGSAGLGLFSFDGRYTTTVASPRPEHAFADYYLGYPFRTQRSTPAAVNLYFQQRISAYVQDDWKVSSRLTLNLGVRYMLQRPWSERDGAYANLDLSNGKLVVPGTSFPSQAQTGLVNSYGVRLSGKDSRALLNTDKNNFAPRVGFAYRMTSDGKMVLRGGAGFYYNTIPLNVGILQLGYSNPPFLLSETFDAAPGANPSLTLAAPFTGSGAVTSSPNINAADPNMVNSLSQQWNLTLEREVARNLTVRASYVGNKTSHLNWYNYNLNLPVEQVPSAVQPRRPYQPWGTINYAASGGDSNYHSMQLEAARRFTSGLTFEFNYSWNRQLDNVPISSTPMNPYRADLDKGNSELVRRHVLGGAFTYELPFGASKRFLNRKGLVNVLAGGWQMSSIMILQTGVPLSVTFNATQTGWNGGRADLVGDPRLSRSDRSEYRWFRTEAFATPAAFTWGNSARNLIFGPGLMGFDVSLLKNFQVTDRVRVQLRGESFNFPNHRNLPNPGTNISSPNVGLITGSLDPRQIQFGLKVIF